MLKEQQCILKACTLSSQSSCLGDSSSDSDRTSGFITPFRPIGPGETAQAAAVETAANASNWGIEALSLELLSAAPSTYGILARGGDFFVRNLNINLRQTNCSSAVKVRSLHRC